MRNNLLLIVLVACLWGCKKSEDITSSPSANLEFSTDSVLFDTVFTSVGSVTKRIKVYNRDKKGVRISHIKLGGGQSSNYSININGVPSSRLDDFVLRGNDSLNVFVKVTVDPNSANTPFIVKDSVEFLTNGNYQKVILSAYGQNAVFLKNVSINVNTTWTNVRPYVIYDNLTVASNTTLTIEKGVKVHFHRDAKMIIAGTLSVQGDVTDTVTFSSDRREQIYADEPGQWGGLHFLSSSKDNIINYAVIKNALIGIRVDSLSKTINPKLILVNSKLHYHEFSALYFSKADIAAFNNVITSGGRYLLYATDGGVYNLKQNTFSNLGSQFARSTPAVYFTDQRAPGIFSNLSVTLINNIIWGNLIDELQVDKKGTSLFFQDIRKNLIKSKNTALASSGNLLNIDPQFVNPDQNKFWLKGISPGSNQGENLMVDAYFNSWLNKDLNNRVRLFPSDLGSYEIL